MTNAIAFKALGNDRRLQILAWLKDPRAHFREQVDGDLHELDPAALRGLVTRVQQVNAPTIVPPQGLSGPALGALNKRHAERLEAQQALQDAMARWGGIGRRLGREREGQKEFFLRFGVDVLTAQTLGASEARDLEARVRQDLC